MALGSRTLLLLLVLVCSVPICGRAEKLERLNYTGYVNDFAGVLSPQAKGQLAALCAEVDTKTHAQIAVVTIHSLQDVSVEEFANQLFKKWGVGYKGENRGVLILLAVADHKYRIEVGYGLEPILPDGKVGGFGREAVPLLRQNNYDAALLQVTGRIAQVIAQDRGITLTSALQPRSNLPAAPVRGPARRGQSPGTIPLQFLLLFLILFLYIVQLINRMYHALTGRWLHGWLVPRTASGGSMYSWGGGSFGGGGDFGGFGGGLSGGGGASGSW